MGGFERRNLAHELGLKYNASIERACRVLKMDRKYALENIAF